MWVASDAFLDKTYLLIFLVSTLFLFWTSSVLNTPHSWHRSKQLLRRSEHNLCSSFMDYFM